MLNDENDRVGSPGSVPALLQKNEPLDDCLHDRPAAIGSLLKIHHVHRHDGYAWEHAFELSDDPLREILFLFRGAALHDVAKHVDEVSGCTTHRVQRVGIYAHLDVARAKQAGGVGCVVHLANDALGSLEVEDAGGTVDDEMWHSSGGG